MRFIKLNSGDDDITTEGGMTLLSPRTDYQKLSQGGTSLPYPDLGNSNDVAQ